MNFKAFLCFVILTFVACESLEDYRLRLEETTCTPRNCTASGPLCETCSNLVGCLEGPDGSWVKTPLGTCNAPSYCVDGACTSDYDPFCWGAADLPFNCSKAGIFPDPFYRSRFVLCVNNGAGYTAYLHSCEPPGFGFNIADDLCSIPVVNGECPSHDYPVPLCLTVGQSAALPEKPQMFYICRERTDTPDGKALLYPYLDICPGGELYENYNCGGPVTPTTEPTTTTPPPTTLP